MFWCFGSLHGRFGKIQRWTRTLESQAHQSEASSAAHITKANSSATALAQLGKIMQTGVAEMEALPEAWFNVAGHDIFLQHEHCREEVLLVCAASLYNEVLAVSKCC